VTASGELVDRGIRAYTQGLLGEAERLWREALRTEPTNQRARAYLALLDPGTHPEPVPVPVAVAVQLDEAPDGSAAVDPAEPLYDRSPWDDGPALSATIVLDSEGGLDLAAVAERVPQGPAATGDAAPAHAGPSRADVSHWMDGARELFALGDFSGSLEMLEKVLIADPTHAEARAYLEENESTLVQMYESKLSPLSGKPLLAIKPEEVMWLNLDHRAGFVLAQIDGNVSFEDLYAVSGLPRLETAKILAHLVLEGVIRAA